MEKREKGLGIKERLQEAVQSTKEAVDGVNLAGVKEKLQETGERALEVTKKVKMPEVDTSKVAGIFKKGEKHMIVQPSGSKVRILFPVGYERLKNKNPLKDAANTFVSAVTAYQKTVSTSRNTIVVFKATPETAMNPADVQGLINGIHENLSDAQGIIEVQNGTTKRGYQYIYSIVKTLDPEQFAGVSYYLRLNLFCDKDIVEVQGEFTEIGMTGMRESACLAYATAAGLASVDANGIRNWTKDPYDADYAKGKLMNLAEKEGIDGLFPDNPLTQAREFLIAALRDEYVIVRKENDDNESASDEDQKDNEDNLTPEEKKEKEKEFLRGLFEDRCRRHTIPVEVEKQKGSEAVDFKADKAKKSKQVEEKDNPDTISITAISTKSALKIIYYLMAADGEIFHSEEEKFDAIGKELDPNFAENKEKIVNECQKQLDKAIEPEDYYDTLQDGVEEALLASRQTADTFVTPKLLVWDLLTIAYSDEKYDEAERKLLKYIVRKTNIDKAQFLEMESSILTLMDIEKELAWIKTTNKPYLTIEGMVNELADRKNVIFESVKDLISL